MNPLYQLLGNKQNPIMEQVRAVGQAMRGSPEALLQNNPQAQQMIRQYGDPKSAFLALAQQMGINPSEVMKTLGM